MGRNRNGNEPRNDGTMQDCPDCPLQFHQLPLFVIFFPRNAPHMLVVTVKTSHCAAVASLQNNHDQPEKVSFFAY